MKGTSYYEKKQQKYVQTIRVFNTKKSYFLYFGFAKSLTHDMT